jgi:ankyrin repeat protein
VTSWQALYAKYIEVRNADGQANVVKYLLAKKADPNLILQTSALCAGVGDDVTITKLLLEAGADPNIVCLDCEYGSGSALEWAAYRGKLEAVQFLIEGGADVNLWTQYGHYGSPLAAAAYGVSVECACWLVRKGAKVNEPLQHGWYGSALVAACAGWGGVEMVQFLIDEAAADPGILRTRPLSKDFVYSAIETQREIKRYLVENGYMTDADIDWLA